MAAKPRDCYQDTIVLSNADGSLVALAEVEIYVYEPGTTNDVRIYDSRVSESPIQTPIITSASGGVEFYADVNEYDIKVHDTHQPPRIADRTFQWNAVNASNQGLSTRL